MMSALLSRHPKYRTKLCRNFTTGSCPFGQKCSFLHPPSGINPPPPLLARHLFNWNTLLPQLLAIPNQQGFQKNMPPRSPPRPQGPQLIDEDSSPSTSLLLSTSDCTTSDQMSETRRSSRRKKYPCRHFVRTGGWCPAGARCKFYHDVAALPSMGVPQAEHEPPSETDAYVEEGRTISGGVLMGIQLPSPRVTSDEHSESLRYMGAELVQPHQPTYWSNYTWQPYQPCYATVPAATTVPIAVTPASSSVMQHDIYSPQPRAQTVASNERLPSGAYEVNGTTYFPTSVPSIPAPAAVTYSVPVHPVPYHHPTTPASAYPYYAYAPPICPASCCYDFADQTTSIRPQTSFDPFASDQMMTSELPVISRPEDYQMWPIQHDVLPPSFSPPLMPTGALVSTTAKDEPMISRGSDPDFPYQPPKNQQVGHARRISVNVKKQGHVHSG